MNNVILGDCMEYMKGVEDNHFELAIVDPPYGISVSHNIGRRRMDKPSKYKKVDWDGDIPELKYFEELKRVSINQIIWGGNYFTEYLKPSSCWVLWDKDFSDQLSFSQFEMAWTSFKSMTKKYNYNPQLQKNRIHPTQKPVALYKWLLQNYAKPNDKIFDSHVGSGSSRIACYELGFDFIGCELDKDYWEAQEERFKSEKAKIDNKFYLPEQGLFEGV